MHSARHGIVYIAQDAPDLVDHRAPRFIGHWEATDPPRLLEAGPSSSDVEDAIAWGRARAEVILVRIGMPGVYYSAGEAQPARGERLPEWPPLGR
jgi:hypothetical protein